MTFSGQLRFFAQDLSPDPVEAQIAKEATDRITRAIHRNFRSYSVDRITPFGSHPKKTSIKGMMDVDIIVYINGRHPPFGDIIEELYQIVRRNIDPDCTKNFFQVKLRYRGVQVDLLPATNFLPTTGSHRGDLDRSIRTQHKRALEHVKYLGARDRDFYSTSLSGVSVFFERSRSSFSHSLSRLAKYWCSFIPVVEDMKPRSSIMEYMAAYAADQVAWEGEDILRGFRYFLNLFEYSDDINIYWTQFYNDEDIPRYIKEQRPLLLDPCNPYNNFLSIYDNADKLKRMQPYAGETLLRLGAAVRDFRQGISVDMDMVISGSISSGGEDEFWSDRTTRVHPQSFITSNNNTDDSDADEESTNPTENSMCILL